MAKLESFAYGEVRESNVGEAFLPRHGEVGKLRHSTSTHNFNYKALLAGLIVVIGGSTIG